MVGRPGDWAARLRAAKFLVERAIERYGTLGAMRLHVGCATYCLTTELLPLLAWLYRISQQR
jgi:hypothetical protein